MQKKPGDMLNSPVHVYDTVHVSADSSEAKTFVEILKTLPTIEFNADYSRKYAQPDPKKSINPSNIFDDGEDLTIFTKIKDKKQETLLIRYDISIRNVKPSSQEIKKILTLRQNLLPLRKNPFEGYRATVSTSSQPEDVSNDQPKKVGEANDDLANLHWDMINRETILDCLNHIIVGASKAHQIRKDFYAWEHKIFDKESNNQKEKQQTLSSPKHFVKSILKKTETNAASKAEQAKNLSILVSENVARRNKNRTKVICSSFKFYSQWCPDVLKSFAQNYVTNLPFMKNMTKILNKEDTLNLKDLCIMSGSRYEDEKGANSQLNKVVNAINQELAVVAEKRSKNREIDNHYIIGKKARNFFNHSKWKKGFTFASSFTDSVLEEIATDYVRRLPFRHNMRYILKQKLKGNTLLDLSDLVISVGGIGNTQKKELVDRVSAKLDEAAKTYQDRKNLGKLFAQHIKKVEYTEGDLVPLFNIQAGPQILNRSFNLFTVNLIYTSELESDAERIRKGLDFKKIVYNKLNTFTCRVRSSLVSSKEALFNYSMFSEQEDGVDLYLYVLDLFQTDLINRFESSHPEESNRSLFTDLMFLDRKVANIAIIQPNTNRDLENIDPKLKAYFEKSNIGLAVEDNGLKSLKDTAVKLIRKSCSQKKAWQAMYYDAFQDMIEFEEENGCSNMDIYEIFKVQAGFDDELYKEFIKDIGVLKTCEEFMTLHFNVSRTIEKQLETKLKELERVRIQVFEGTGEAKKRAAKSIPEIRTEIKRLKLTSIKLSKMLDKEIEETPLVLKERKVKMLKRFRGHKLVKGSDTAALLKELEEMRKKLVALLGSEERLINIQNLYEKYIFEFRGEMSNNLNLTERDLPPQYVNMFRIFNEFLLNSMDDEDAFKSRNIKEILLAFINDNELNTNDPKEEGSQPMDIQKPQETQEKQEKQEEVQETTAQNSPATYKETLLSGYETIKQITTKELSASNDATGDLKAFFKNSQTKMPEDLDDLFGQVWADDTVQQVDLTQKQDINGLLINQLPGTDINASENPYRTQEILTLTEDKLMPMLKEKIDQLKEEMEKAFAKFVADYEQQKDASSVQEFQRTIYINQVYLSSLEEKYSSLENEKQAISYAFELYKRKYEEADANILLGFEKLSYDFKNERIEIQNKMDEIESRLFGYEQETTDVSFNYRLRTHEDIAHFFRGFTTKSELKVVRDYFFQIQKTLKAYANNCVALEEDMFGLNNQILKVVPYGNAIAKIFKLYETSPEYKDKHIPKERNLRFSDLVPNMSKFSEIAEETALQLAMNKADLILKLSSNVNATMLKIDPDERYRYGLDTGSKVLAYIDASCIIANVYTGFLCPLELQDDPDDIYNTLPIISMFTESAKMVVAGRYEELLGLLDEKYHTNLCRVCGAHNNKSTFKVKTNNYVADPPHEAWGIDEIHVNICDGKCSKCQDKGVIKDVWNVKKTQTYKLQKLEHMWIDNIHPTSVTNEVITHNGRSLKVSKSEYEKNFRIKNEVKPRPVLRNLLKLDTTAPLKSSEKPLVLAMESDSENENEIEVTYKEINSKLENIANIDFSPGASDSTAPGLGSPLVNPRKVPKLDNITSPGASDSTALGQSSPLASPRKNGEERKIVWLGSTKVYNIKNVSDHVKEVEDEVRESSKKVNVGEVKKEHLRKIYGLKKIRS